MSESLPEATDTKMEGLKRRLSHALSGDGNVGHTGKSRGRRGALSAFHFKRASVSKNLVAAAEAGDATKIRQLLEGGPELGDIEHTDKAVRIACEKGHLEVLATLIRYGATINSLGDENSAPLHVAVRHESISIITLLISNGVNVNIQTKFEKRSPLHVAALFGKEEALRALLSADSRINHDIRDIYGTTPLHLAARMGHMNVVKILLSNNKRVDVDSYDNEGWTALHLAAESGNKETVQMLIDHHSQIDCQNKYGRTPLHWATIKRHPVIVHLLLIHKASPTLKDLHNKCAMDYADDQRIKQMLMLKTGATFQSDLSTPTDSTIGDFMKIEARGSFIRRLADPLPHIIRNTASVKKKKYDVSPIENMDTITEEIESRRSSSSKSEEETFMGQSFTEELSSIKGSLIRSLFNRKQCNGSPVSSASVSRCESYRSTKSNGKEGDSYDGHVCVNEKLIDPISIEVHSELLSIPSLRSDPTYSPCSSRNASPVSQRRMYDSIDEPEPKVPEVAIMGQTQFQALITKIERHQLAIENIVNLVSGEVTKAASGKRQMSNTDLMNIGNKMHKIQDLIFDFREDVSQQAKLIRTTMRAFVETIKQRLSPRDVLPASIYHAFIYSAATYLEKKTNGHKHLIQKLSCISEEARSDMLENVTNSGVTTSQKCSQSLYFVLENMPEQEKNTPLRCILQLLTKCNFESNTANTTIRHFIELARPNMKHSLEHNNLFILSYRLGNDGKALADQLQVSIRESDEMDPDSKSQRLDHVCNLEMLSIWRQKCTSMTTCPQKCVLDLVMGLILIGREDLLVWILSNNRYDENENQSIC